MRWWDRIRWDRLRGPAGEFKWPPTKLDYLVYAGIVLTFFCLVVGRSPGVAMAGLGFAAIAAHFPAWEPLVARWLPKRWRILD